MMPMRRVRLSAVVGVLALMLTAGIAGQASAGLIVNGDAAAWREVLAAFSKLNGLSGYRMKSAMPGGTMVMEFTSGGTSMHMLMQTAHGNMEMVRVGDQVRERSTMGGGPPGWRCQGIPPVSRPADPTSYQGTVDVSRGPDSVIDGQPVHAYVWTLQRGGMPGGLKSTLYVGANNGLPRRIVSAGPQGEQSMDYYDYGAPINNTLPACGGS
jgi:hypothetical protein